MTPPRRLFPLERRPSRHAGAVVFAVPPSPESMYAKTPDEEGFIAAYYASANGTITGLRIFIEYTSKEPVRFRLKTIRGQDEFILGFALNQGENTRSTEEKIDVLVGDRLMFMLADSAEVSGIWISFVFQIHPGSPYIQVRRE